MLKMSSIYVIVVLECEERENRQKQYLKGYYARISPNTNQSTDSWSCMNSGNYNQDKPKENLISVQHNKTAEDQAKTKP